MQLFGKMPCKLTRVYQTQICLAGGILVINLKLFGGTTTCTSKQFLKLSNVIVKQVRPVNHVDAGKITCPAHRLVVTMNSYHKVRVNNECVLIDPLSLEKLD